MPYALSDTIAAIASPAGGAGRGIVRLSGPDVRRCLDGVLYGHPSHELGTMTVASAVPVGLSIPGLASAFPAELFLWPDVRSYTGQPTAEIHTLGSQPLLAAALRAICEAGARLAEPGEFTLRAFLAGRIDLTRAEAVLGVIDAADRNALEIALAQLAGGLSSPLQRLRSDLLDLLAGLEAGFDFAEEDLTFISHEELASRLAEAEEAVERLARQMASRQDTQASASVVLVGWPNTGKSSLFNALAGRGAALVSEHPGTTRDYLTAELDLDGQRCLLVDTAGVSPERGRASAGPELAAQEATDSQAGRAEIRLLCLDSSRAMNPWERGQLEPESNAFAVVLTKVDAPRQIDLGRPALETSSRTGTGIDRLRRRIAQMLLARGAFESRTVAGTAVRCRESLHTAAESLRQAQEVLRAGTGEELVAAELRAALDGLGQVVGAVYTEDVLARIFSRFCVGK
jgi:tRNA modification GTPase